MMQRLYPSANLLAGGGGQLTSNHQEDERFASVPMGTQAGMMNLQGQPQGMDFVSGINEQREMLLRQEMLEQAQKQQQNNFNAGFVPHQPQPQLTFSATEDLLDTSHFSNAASNVNHKMEGMGGNGMDALVRHQGLFDQMNHLNNNGVPSIGGGGGIPASSMGEMPASPHAIDVKNKLTFGGQGQFHQGEVARQRELLLADQMVREERLRRLATSLPAQVPSSLFQSGQQVEMNSIPSPDAPSMGLAGMNGMGGMGGGIVNHELLAQHLLQQQLSAQQAAQQQQRPPLPVVPPSLRHLQPVPHKKRAAKRKKKPADKPKRPLSAYNLFFRDERARILASIPSPSGYKKKKRKSKKNKDKDGAAAAQARDQQQPQQQPEAQTEDAANANNANALVGRGRAAPHGKIGFENLAKIIGKRWQDLTEKEAKPYKKRAEREMVAYRGRMEEWLAKQQQRQQNKDASSNNDNREEEENEEEEAEMASRDDRKRKSEEAATDADNAVMFASVQKKMKRLHHESPAVAAPFSSLPATMAPFSF
eukprot:CAMPEP_0197439494 /NCGR_PEP_ID=MMETSP1175-20131217/6220_1 /TAXON_ID=1003142 /ORGANISM="Triceratium dubium, Strain CCMP147" /LENGTH=534 /DNA_ID=CAMNT_0042969419 /DNA_START=267 /DNA_END=1871 /DNA_ORIENTATION=-